MSKKEFGAKNYHLLLFPFIVMIIVFFCSLSASAYDAVKVLAIGGTPHEGESTIYNASFFYDCMTNIFIDEKTCDVRGIAQASSRSEISSAISAQFGNNTDETLSIFYYGGHGNQVGLEVSSKSTFSFTQLYDELNSINGDVVVILDACYSGGFITNNDIDTSKFLVWTACDEDTEAATYNKNWVRTLLIGEEQVTIGKFTEAILNGLGYFNDQKLLADSNDNDSVTLSELYSYVKKKCSDIPPMKEGKLSAKFSYYYITLNRSSLDMTAGEESTLLQATVMGNDSKVVWKSKDKSIATVKSSSKTTNGNETIYTALITGKKNGSTTVSATVGSKKAKCTVTVANLSIELNITSVTLYQGQKLQLAATVEGSSDAVIWSSSDSSKVSVNSKGKIKAKENTSTPITITATVKGVTAECKVTVQPTIKLNVTKKTLYKDATYTLKATVKGSTSTVVWKSSDKSIVKVNSKGKITAKKAGTVTITATVDGVSVECTVKVKNPTISVTPTSIALYVGSKSQLSATVKGVSKTVTWESSDTSIATVGSDGTIEGKKAGTVIITATANDKTATCTVTVIEPTITLSQSSLEISAGDTASVKATVMGTNSSVTWESSDTTVATVTDSGKITGIKAGSATITATANGVSATCIVTVTGKSDALSQIDLTKYLGMDIEEGIKQLVTDCGGADTELYQKAIACFNGGLSGNAFEDGLIVEANLNAMPSVDGIYSGDQTVTIAGFYKGISVSEANSIIQSKGWKLSNTVTLYGSYYYRYYTKGNVTVLLETMVSEGKTFGPYIYCVYSGYEKLITPKQ